MKLLVSVGITVVFSLADAFFGLVFYIHGNKFSLFGRDLYDYEFTHCLFEFWLFSIIRLTVLLGGALGVVCNPQDGAKRIKSARYVVGVIATVCVMYSVAKILVYTEYVDGNHENDTWFWTSVLWSILASFCMYGMWIVILKNVKPPRNNGKFDLLINDEREETNPCSETESDCEDSSDSDDDGGSEDEDRKGGKNEEKKRSKSVRGRSAFFRLLVLSRHDFVYLLIGFTALLCASAGEVFLPLYTGKVIDGVAISKQHGLFQHAILVMAILSMGVGIANGIRGGFFSVAMARLNLRITSMLYESITKQEIGFFDKTRTGAITSRLTSDTSIMSDTLGTNLNICLRSLVQIVGYVVFMIILSWRLAVITLITFPLIAVISDIFGSYYEKLAQKVQTSLAKANIVAEETISTMKTVRSFANEAGERRTYRSKLDVTYRLRRKEAVAYGSFMILESSSELLMFVVTLFYGGHLVEKGIITGGMMVSFILYQLELGGCIADIADVYTDLMKAAGASRKVFELIDREPAIKNDGTLSPRQLDGHLEFKNVHFAYPTSSNIPVLKDVSFCASPGEVVALVGPSGGGKSSCINLLQHFYQPTAGHVLLDGRSVAEYEHDYLHSKISLVGQEPVLYARSIRDNISYGLEECSQDRVQEAAGLANAHNFISHLKKGYDSETGEKGLQLSGGQKQRVAIARALVRDPQVLLLDEATSALDAESEHLVQQALSKNLRDRTVVIVAHRLSTIEKADRIMVIDHGAVVEQGPHHELIKAGGLYAKLVQRQLMQHDDNDEGDDDDDDNNDDRGGNWTEKYTPKGGKKMKEKRRPLASRRDSSSSAGSSLGSSSGSSSDSDDYVGGGDTAKR